MENANMSWDQNHEYSQPSSSAASSGIGTSSTPVWSSIPSPTYLPSVPSSQESDGVYSEPGSKSPRVLGYLNDPVHNEENFVLNSRIIVHKFNGKITRRTWFYPMIKRIKDGRIPDIPSTTIQILSGIHGDTHGVSGLVDPDLTDKTYYDEDCRLIEKLQKDGCYTFKEGSTVNIKDIKFKVHNVPAYTNKIDNLIDDLKSFMNFRGENHIFLAWCHSNHFSNRLNDCFKKVGWDNNDVIEIDECKLDIKNEETQSTVFTLPNALLLYCDAIQEIFNTLANDVYSGNIPRIHNTTIQILSATKDDYNRDMELVYHLKMNKISYVDGGKIDFGAIKFHVYNLEHYFQNAEHSNYHEDMISELNKFFGKRTTSPNGATINGLNYIVFTSCSIKQPEMGMKYLNLFCKKQEYLKKVKDCSFSLCAKNRNPNIKSMKHLHRENKANNEPLYVCSSHFIKNNVETDLRIFVKYYQLEIMEFKEFQNSQVLESPSEEPESYSIFNDDEENERILARGNKRKRFSKRQLCLLEQAFKLNTPGENEWLNEVAKDTNLSLDQVKNWFTRYSN